MVKIKNRLVAKQIVLRHVLIVGIASCLLVTGKSIASPFDEARYYLGGAITLTHQKYNAGQNTDLNLFKEADSDNKLAIQKNQVGADIYAGFRYNNYLGAEIGYGTIAKTKSNVQNNNLALNRIYVGYLDAVLYKPLMLELDLVLTAGFGLIKNKPDVRGSNLVFTEKDKLERKRINYRFGAGIEYRYLNTIGIRALVRYHRSGRSFLRYIVAGAIGISYWL